MTVISRLRAKLEPAILRGILDEMPGTGTMKTVITCAVAGLLLAGLPISDARAQDIQTYECVAQNRLAGREEAKPESPQTLMRDGQPRYVEKGDPGYMSVEKGEAIPDWIELYGAQNGHASSFLGFYKSKDFKCMKVDG